MNKQQLVAHIADTLHSTQAEAERALTAVISALEVALQQDKPLILPGFATFSVRQRAARTGRNPRNGETLAIPACRVPYLKASTRLKTRLNTRNK